MNKSATTRATFINMTTATTATRSFRKRQYYMILIVVLGLTSTNVLSTSFSVSRLLSYYSSATTTNSEHHQYRPWPKLVYKCGYHADTLANFVFPNVTHQYYEGFLSLQQQRKHQQANNPNSTTATAQQEADTVPLIFGMHGPCNMHADLNEENDPPNSSKGVNAMWVHHVQRYYFLGNALFVNGESHGEARSNNIYQVGAITKHDGDSMHDDHSLPDFYYMTLFFLEVAPTPQQRELIFDHAKKPKNTGKYNGVTYMASSCVTFRQEAADRISDVDPENLIVYYGGTCRGLRKPGLSSKLLPVPDDDYQLGRRDDYNKNRHLFQRYRYCLVMENKVKSGYITEKIINAFLGGCVPIYYGTTEVFDIFNKDAFIFYDIKNPEVALEQIRYMEKENRSAYDDMLAQPILANGTDTIKHYFSLQDDIGGGKLIRKIRTMLGYDPNNPFDSRIEEV